MGQGDLGLSGGRGKTPAPVAQKAKAGPRGGHLEGRGQISVSLSGLEPLLLVSRGDVYMEKLCIRLQHGRLMHKVWQRKGALAPSTLQVGRPYKPHPPQTISMIDGSGTHIPQDPINPWASQRSDKLSFCSSLHSDLLTYFSVLLGITQHPCSKGPLLHGFVMFRFYDRKHEGNGPSDKNVMHLGVHSLQAGSV